MAAYTTIDNPEAYFKAVLYTGNNTAIGSGGKTVTGVGFQSDFTWIKSRSSTAPQTAMDAVRGSLRTVYVNSTSADQEVAENISTWNSDGWVMGSNGDINAVQNYVGWNWKANGSGSANTAGSINTTATSANTTSGFSIIKWTGNATISTIGHGIGKVPEFMLFKNVDDATNWNVYHRAAGSPDEIGNFNTNGAFGTYTGYWQSTVPSTTLITMGTDNDINGSSDSMLAYVWAPVQGFSKFGKYTGNGNVDGPFLYTGFRPAFFFMKRTDTTSNWTMFHNRTTPGNEIYVSQDVNVLNDEDADTGYNDVDFCANGVKIREDNNDLNASGAPFIYVCFAESPFVNSEGVPCNAR